MMAGVLAELAPILAGRRDRFILCSMAAGLSMDQLLEMAGGDFPVIRILPNTPAAIGQGVAQFCVRGVTAEEKADFLTLLVFGRDGREADDRRQLHLGLRDRLLRHAH